MRRILSFLSMAVTLLAIVFFGVPSVMEDPNLGLEFKGGYEIVYEVTDKDGNSSNDVANAAAEVIATRIDIAGVRNPNISIEGSNGEFIRVAIASSDDEELTEVILNHTEQKKISGINELKKIAREKATL